jgi:NADPH-dependent glutamate synthase beta subunit-like oxidoreductase
VCIRACPAEFSRELRFDNDTTRGYVYTNTELETMEVLPPCVGACPLSQQVRSYVELLESGEAKEALLVIRQDNPLPGVCGYVCHHPCEQACVRGSWDDAVAIRELKRYAVEYEREHRDEILEVLNQRKQPARGKKVVIVGAGPAGLACAFELTMQGYEVRVMDALSEPGGMLVGCIPPFRLPREVIAHDVGIIRSLGVEFITSVRVENLNEIKQNGADAVVLATGTWKDLTLGVPGEGSEGYLDCLDFLGKVNRSERIDLSGIVAVIGGGNAAFDTARSALRLGPDKVIVLYRRSQEEMPAALDERHEAEREGVEIRYLVAPTRILNDGGRVNGIELVRMELGGPDDTGRRRPIPIKGSEFIEKADVIITAIGQRPELSFLTPEAVSEQGTVCCESMGTVRGYEGIFAAGDTVSGPSTVVEALASGKAVAHQVINYLEKGA